MSPVRLRSACAPDLPGIADLVQAMLENSLPEYVHGDTSITGDFRYSFLRYCISNGDP